jgi:hypothetical protein
MWLIKNCPNFYFMPSICYDRIFVQWEDQEITNMSPNYWSEKGFPAIELIECDEADATYWIVNSEYGAFCAESAQSARNLGKTVKPVKEKL